MVHEVVTRGRTWIVRTPKVQFFFKCLQCKSPKGLASIGQVGTISDGFCKACDMEVKHKVVKEIVRK